LKDQRLGIDGLHGDKVLVGKTMPTFLFLKKTLIYGGENQARGHHNKSNSVEYTIKGVLGCSNQALLSACVCRKIGVGERKRRCKQEYKGYCQCIVSTLNNMGSNYFSTQAVKK